MDEINDIGNVIANTIDNKGEDKRNFFGILRAQRGATDLYNISGDSLNLLNEAYKSNKIGADEYKEGLRNIIEATGNDLGLNVSLVYLDTSTMPKDSEGSTGSSYIVDRKNRKVLIPIDVNKIEDIKELLGTLTEEVAHGKDALEGRQDKKVAEDKSNDEEGLETLGRPANDYVKNKLGDKSSNIQLTTDGIDLTNANVGEKVGDSDFVLETVAATGTGMVTGISAPVVAGVAVVGSIVYYNIFMPEEEKEQLKREISQIYEDVKEGFGSILNKEDFKDIVVAVFQKKLKEKGIEADVKIDKDGNVMYTMIPVPEEKRVFKLPPFPLPEEEKNPQLPPMDPPKQETQKERWEREERDRREQKERDNERSKPNGIPLQQERPVTIIYTKSDGKKFDGKYKPSPKHDPKTGYPGASKSNIPDIETGQELLEDSYGSSKVKQRYVWYRGRLVEFQPGNDGTWHDYTVDGNEVPIDVLRQMRDDGIITNSEYQKLKKGKK